MTTIRKNSNEFKRAQESALLVKRFCLENDFSGKFQHGIDESYFKDGKMTKGIGYYTLRVHSNLWFEWSVA